MSDEDSELEDNIHHVDNSYLSEDDLADFDDSIEWMYIKENQTIQFSVSDTEYRGVVVSKTSTNDGSKSLRVQIKPSEILTFDFFEMNNVFILSH